LKKHIAFLRGINVGNIRIKMPDLQRAFADMGFDNAVTYLQTGNVVFGSNLDLPAIKETLEKGLTATFHYQAYVLPYPLDALGGIVAGYPFESLETHHDYIMFVETEAVLGDLTVLAQPLAGGPENIAAGDGVIYWQAPKGSSTDSPFAKILGKAKYKSTTTVRNINTLQKILDDN
jgi:uncharacterized protein (DUF1697 family)